MGKKLGQAEQHRLQSLLNEIFVAKGPGVSKEAFGEDDWLLNMSSRVNAGERIEPDQIARIEEIWRHEKDRQEGRRPFHEPHKS